MLKAESYVHKFVNGRIYPQGCVQNIDAYMISDGLDSYDTTEDVSTPACLGNFVGERVTK